MTAVAIAAGFRDVLNVTRLKWRVAAAALPPPWRWDVDKCLTDRCYRTVVIGR